MNNNEIVQNLVKLQVLCARYTERHTNLQCLTFRDLDRILKGGKFTINYGEAFKNLKSNIEKYCLENEFLNKSVLGLETEIEKIKNLRFGEELPQHKFTKEEKELDTLIVRSTLFYTGEMMGIKEVSELIGISETAIKQAAQQERLLNTKKINSKTWLVHLPECMAYWNKTIENNGVYANWTY